MSRVTKKRIFPVCAGLVLLISVLQGISGAEEVKKSCLTADGAVITVNESAYLRINYQSQFLGTWRDTGSGRDLTDPTFDFYFRRNRLTMSGQASEGLGYFVALEHTGDRRIGALDVAEEPQSDFDVIDAYVSADLGSAFQLLIGKTKIPFTREVLDGCFSPLSLDRSLFIATPMKRTRDEGLVAWGNLAGKKVQYMAAVQEGRDSGLAPESSPRYTGRLHLALLDPEVGFGYQGSYLGNKMVFTVGAAAQYEPGAVYDNVSGLTGEKDYQAWTADLFLEYPVGMNGSFTLSGAYLETDFDKAYEGTDPDPDSIGADGQKKGWYGKAGYLFSGNLGPGQFQPFVRYESWEFALLDGVFVQEVKWTGLGFNYYIRGQNLRITLEYSETDFTDEVSADSRDFKTVSSMLQFGF